MTPRKSLRIPRLVVATRNPGKLKEIKAVLGTNVGEVLGLDDVRGAPEVEEDGKTFEANAKKKAREVWESVGGWVLADDSGIEVDVLGGAPGVRSARYATQKDREKLGIADDAVQDVVNNAKLLNALAGMIASRRVARFRAVIALISPDGHLELFEGVCEGRVSGSPRGKGGFGYDPIFEPAGEGRSMAEIPLREKNRISHRGKALHMMKGWLASG